MRRPASLALALGCAAFVLASCGGGEDAKLLPGATAREITENLDTVKLLAAEGECVGAANEAEEVRAQVETLSGVDAKLKQALEAGTERLNEVVSECEGEVSTETVEPTTEETTTEDEERLPPGQEKKAEKEREHEEKQLEKEEAKDEKHEEAPPETTPAEPPTTPAPPSEGGGTDASGGVSAGEPVVPGAE
jgi:outer membrane biosynthesis protein TonB